MSASSTILLTGASAGIGLAAARALTAAGHEVWGTARDIARLPTMTRFHPIAMDLNDTEGLRQRFANAADDAGGFDVLINNAGEVINAPLEVLTGGPLREQFETLFFGPMELIRLALPRMRAQARRHDHQCHIARRAISHSIQLRLQHVQSRTRRCQ